MRTTINEHKRVIQVELSESALAEAAGLDISQVLEEALRSRSTKTRSERWQINNSAAIAWHNALTDRMGGTLHEILNESAAEEITSVARDNAV